MKSENEIKALSFASSIMNAYKEEEDREYVRKIELNEESLNDEFVAMIQAVFAIYINITRDNKTDLLGFTHLINRLVFQYLSEKD